MEADKEYIRKLMSFRKDELILPDSSDEDEEDYLSQQRSYQKPVKDIEDAYGIVDTLETQLRNISAVVEGMDKRMGSNLRMIGKVIVPEKYNNIQK